MANKLAGQKAKYTKAYTDYQKTEDEDQRRSAIRRMAEVIRDAPANGFSESEVTSGKHPLEEVRHLLLVDGLETAEPAEDPEQLIRQLEQTVDRSDLREEGHGAQCIYAYGYRCAPGRLKVGRTERDVLSRVAEQITTSTPDRPAIFLIIYTDECRALERAMHAFLQFRGRRITGGGGEWFLTTRDELLDIYRAINGSSPRPCMQQPNN